MSTNFNRRRGAKAYAPRKVRTCIKLRVKAGVNTFGACGNAIAPNANGNRCEECR